MLKLEKPWYIARYGWTSVCTCTYFTKDAQQNNNYFYFVHSYLKLSYKTKWRYRHNATRKLSMEYLSSVWCMWSCDRWLLFSVLAILCAVMLWFQIQLNWCYYNSSASELSVLITSSLCNWNYCSKTQFLFNRTTNVAESLFCDSTIFSCY